MLRSICPFDLPSEPASGRPPCDPAAEAAFCRAWLQESWLVWTRWAVTAVLLILPLSAATWQDAAVRSLPLILLALGNSLIAQQLRTRSTTFGSIRRVRWHATLLEWATVLAVFTVLASSFSGIMAPVLQVLVLLAAVRFGLVGIAVASSSAALAVGARVSAQALLLDVVAAETMLTLVVQHTALLICAVLVLVALTQAGSKWRHREENRWGQLDATALRIRSGLSAQEVKVLQLLRDDDLTYVSIGHALHISGETVKTHVRRIGGKWNVSGRRQIVAEARRRNLLPPHTAAAPDERS